MRLIISMTAESNPGYQDQKSLLASIVVTCDEFTVVDSIANQLGKAVETASSGMIWRCMPIKESEE